MQSVKTQEIDSIKRRIDKYRPLSSHELKELKEYYRIGLTYSSNAIEGNSLTESETKIVIEEGITIGGKPLKDHYEAVGHSEAYDFLFTLAKNDKITENDIQTLHRLFYSRIDQMKAGKYRKVQVFLTGSLFIPPSPEKVPQLMKKLITDLPLLAKKYHPVEYAASLHKEIAAIHPFIDGNGRTARLAMNLALIQKGYVITIIPPILRNEYIKTIKQSQIGAKNKKPFLSFITSVVLESHREYLRLLESLRGS